MKMTRSEAGKLGFLKSKATIEKNALQYKENDYKNPKFCKFCKK